MKENLQRPNAGPSGYTDDGFSMGLAFILNTLNQDEQFDAVNWFGRTNDNDQDVSIGSKSNMTRSTRQSKDTITTQSLGEYQHRREFESIQSVFDCARVLLLNQTIDDLKENHQTGDVHEGEDVDEMEDSERS